MASKPKPAWRPDAGAARAAASASGAALPLVLWVVVLLGASGATLVERLPFWGFALLVVSPVLVLALALALRRPRDEGVSGSS